MTNQKLLQEIYNECVEGVRQNRDNEEVKALFQSIQADVIELADNLGTTIKSGRGVTLPLR